MIDWRYYSCKELCGHTKSVRCLKLSKSRLVSGSNDSTVKVWDINSKNTSHVSLEGHSGGITGVDSEGSYVVSGSWDGSIRLWEPTRTTRSLRVLSGHHGPVLDVKLKESLLASCSADKTLQIWRSIRNPQAIGETLEGHDELISCMQFINSHLVSGSYDCMAKVWDIPKAYCTMTLHGHTGPIHTLQGSGTLLITGSFDKTVKLWDLVSGSCIATLREKSLVWKVCLSHKHIACGTLAGGLCMWDMRTCSAIFQTNAHDGCVKDLTFTNGNCGFCPITNVPTSHIVSGSSDSTVKVWCVDNTTGCAKVMRTHHGEVMCLEAGEDHIASGGEDGKVCLCNSPPPQKASTDTPTVLSSPTNKTCHTCHKPITN